MSATAEIAEIVDTFDLLGDWDQRYQYLIELGERMPPMPASEKNEANLVKECMSTVHVAARMNPEKSGSLIYTGDCDTSIIKGVVALLVDLFSDKTPDEVQALDVDGLFAGLHLDEHLSPNRHVGVYAIVDKMKAEARALS
jgi:cysteine desulfuration protein SufE